MKKVLLTSVALLSVFGAATVLAEHPQMDKDIQSEWRKSSEPAPSVDFNNNGSGENGQISGPFKENLPKNKEGVTTDRTTPAPTGKEAIENILKTSLEADASEAPKAETPAMKQTSAEAKKAAEKAAPKAAAKTLPNTGAIK